MEDRLMYLQMRRRPECSRTSTSSRSMRGLTPRWSGRVDDKVPSSNAGMRAAQLNR